MNDLQSKVKINIPTAEVQRSFALQNLTKHLVLIYYGSNMDGFICIYPESPWAARRVSVHSGGQSSAVVPN